jgi:hypothetical protein
MATVQRTIMLPKDVNDRPTKQAETEDRPMSRIVSNRYP